MRYILLGGTFLVSSIQGYAQVKNRFDSLAVQIPLNNQEDTMQYAIGAYIGHFLVDGGFLSLDLDRFLLGLQDVYALRELRIPDSSILPLINAYQLKLQKKRGEAFEKKMFDELKNRKDITALASGVQYAILKPGSGAKPGVNDSVAVNLQGKLADGTVFSPASTPSISTRVNKLVPGLQEVLPLMREGAQWEVYLPANLAYGSAGKGKIIPPFTALSVIVRLEKILH
ncbi:MAG TPA: FKBP-type peptidyl-prolyl cis-trans isomerase [Sediminibacterium sp.]|nr:FKBP-type peptidyl-prolyl cis-trans isomerase [Sediminibacterium sp.]